MGYPLLDPKLRTTARPRPQVEQHTVEGLLTLVERERSGEVVDRQLMQSLLRMLHSLGTYPEGFQRPFLEQSRLYYQVRVCVHVCVRACAYCSA